MYHLCLAGHVLSQTSTPEDELNSVEINENQPNEKRKAVSPGLPTARESTLSGTFRQRSRAGGAGPSVPWEREGLGVPWSQAVGGGALPGSRHLARLAREASLVPLAGPALEAGDMLEKLLAAESWLGQKFLLSFPAVAGGPWGFLQV